MPLFIPAVLVARAATHVGAVARGLVLGSTPPSIVTGAGVDVDTVAAISVAIDARGRDGHRGGARSGLSLPA